MSSSTKSSPSLELIERDPRTPNAPVQARWANARRAGPTPPNPPTVACNRLLGAMLTPISVDCSDEVIHFLGPGKRPLRNNVRQEGTNEQVNVASGFDHSL